MNLESIAATAGPWGILGAGVVTVVTMMLKGLLVTRSSVDELVRSLEARIDEGKAQVGYWRQVAERLEDRGDLQAKQLAELTTIASGVLNGRPS